MSPLRVLCNQKTMGEILQPIVIHGICMYPVASKLGPKHNFYLKTDDKGTCKTDMFLAVTKTFKSKNQS